jgi:hypothetical protein
MAVAAENGHSSLRFGDHVRCLPIIRATRVVKGVRSVDDNKAIVRLRERKGRV